VFTAPAAGEQKPIFKETVMRKIRIMEHISLDGVIQQSADENDFPYGA
jgi:hypothetical protein